MDHQFAQLAPFKATLMMCFIVSLGICCNILPMNILPIINSDIVVGVMNSDDLAYTMSSVGVILLALFGDIIMVRFIRGKTAYHQAQEVFWPVSCRHCAKAVGFQIMERSPDNVNTYRPYQDNNIEEPHSCITQSPDTPDDDHHPACLGIGSPKTHDRKTVLLVTGCQDMITDENHVMPKSTDSQSHTENLGTKHSMFEDHKKRHDRVSQGLQNTHDGDCHSAPLFKRPHKSLLQIYTILTFVSIAKVIIVIIADIMCILQPNETYGRKISFVAQAVGSGTFGSLLILSLIFLNSYYDAIFIRSGKFCYPVGFMFAGCIWLIIFQIGSPFDPSDDEQPKQPCKLNGSFGQLVFDFQDTTVSFVGECGITAGGIFWHMWSSTLPKGVLKLSPDATPSFECVPKQHSQPIWRKIYIFVSKWINYRKPLHTCDSTSQTDITSLQVQNDNRKQNLDIFILKLFLGLLILVLMNITAVPFLRWDKITSQKSRFYLIRCCEIACGIPLIGTLHFQSFVTNKRSQSFPMRRGLSVLNGLTSSDRILLLGCGGIFIISLFRVFGAITFLIFSQNVSNDDQILSYFMILFAVFKIYVTWLMTSFLFIAQRQYFDDIQKIKWSLICSMYTGMFSVTVWVLGNTSIHPWVGLQLFIGTENGRYFGKLMDPLVSLYGIHSTLVALKTFKEIYHERMRVCDKKDSFYNFA